MSPVSVYEEGIYAGYRYFDSYGVEPLYPFGFGLSYTSFELSDYAVSVEGENVKVSVKVANTGSYVGKEVVQVYVSAPAGKLDHPGEDPELCARRELSEETGLTAESVTKLVALRTTPGFCNETIHLYMARGLTQGERHLDEDEFLNVEWIPLEELTDRIVRGEIEDAKTIAALLMAREILRREREA